MNEEEDELDFDKGYLDDLLYSLIDMTREILPLSKEEIAKLDEIQAELMEDSNK